MLLQNLFISFRISGVFANVQATHAIFTNAPPNHYGCWLLNCAMFTSQMVLFILSLKEMVPVISKNNFST